MMISAFAATPSTRSISTKKRSRCKTYSLKMLRQYIPQDLPLLVHVSSAAIETDHIVYNCTLSSLTTKNAWSVSYRYSEFLDFRTQLEELWTCQDECSGSCQAVREYVSACFPKKRLAIISTNQSTISSRKSKFENVLMHLLRCVLLPGSAMKCFHARQHLPDNLFKFLGVENEVDRRSILQIFIDNYQDVLREASLTESFHSNASTVDSASDSTMCMICLFDVDMEHDHQPGSSEKDSTPIVLPCKHVFHRDCIFEWLLFEVQCPVCRVRMCPNAVTNYCRPKYHVQWWLADFDEDSFHPSPEFLKR